MKPSIVFDRWIADNAVAIEQDTAAFKKLVAFASLYLKMLERNRNGVSAGTAEAIQTCFVDLKIAMAGRDLTPPNITLPKIKVVRPGPRKRNA